MELSLQTKMGFVCIRSFSRKHIVCFPSGIPNIYNAFSNLTKHLQKAFFLSVCIADTSFFSFISALLHFYNTLASPAVNITSPPMLVVCVCVHPLTVRLLAKQTWRQRGSDQLLLKNQKQLWKKNNLVQIIQMSIINYVPATLVAHRSSPQ